MISVINPSHGLRGLFWWRMFFSILDYTHSAGICQLQASIKQWSEKTSSNVNIKFQDWMCFECTCEGRKKKTCKQPDTVPLQEPLLNSLSRTSRYFSPGTKDDFQSLTLNSTCTGAFILFVFYLLTVHCSDNSLKLLVSSTHMQYYLQYLLQLSKYSNTILWQICS